MTLISGCVSLPKPNKEEMEKIPPVLRDVAEKLLQKNNDGALELLDKAFDIVTSNKKLAGGKGASFKDEAKIIAQKAAIEFDRENIILAQKYWGDSLSVQYNGLAAQYEVDKTNARISDALNDGVNAAAQSYAIKNKQSFYTYDSKITYVSKPVSIDIGLPDKGVLRFPIQVENYPFNAVVKLRFNGKYCTATMISSRIAITAAHCLEVTGDRIEYPAAIMLTKLGIDKSLPLFVDIYFTHKGENQEWDKKRRNDWAVLVTKEKFESNQGFLPVSKDIPKSIFNLTQKIMLPGYSSDLNKGHYMNLHYGCNFKIGQKEDSDYYITNCENAKGSSGAPVITADKPYKIIGIHTAQVATPKDDFYSIETFDKLFIETLDYVLGKYGDNLPMSQSSIIVGATSNIAIGQPELPATKASQLNADIPSKTNVDSRAEFQRQENIHRMQGLAGATGSEEARGKAL